MSSTTYLKSFFHQLGEVVNELVEMFPDDPDFKMFKTFLSITQKTNPTMIIDGFHEYVTSKHEPEIDARNEDFFLNYAVHEYESSTVDIIGKIKTYWTSLSAESKDVMWQYIYILKELTKRYKSGSP
jgi:hypothetical protein